ncbi:PSP1-domain-containing protein [Obba rivulosa]|uniref:PSP1-domain-containing protein n=1 Tax=Obba rivulosa TaxID=1052685 RepID=A0A8E2DQY1_9APHY|nr:PSP1-domain-containing protein [Obba rivulosa]
MSSSGHHLQPDDDPERRNRFLSAGSDTPHSLRDRAASQPPRSTSQGLSPTSIPAVRSNAGAIWPRLSSGLNPNPVVGALPQSVPTRSASFSASSPSNTQGGMFSSAMRDSHFASTFEDDESEALSDLQDPYDPLYDDRYSHANMQTSRGRTWGGDMTRSRSQSLATSRPGPIGSGLPSHGSAGYWNESSLSNPLSIPQPRYGELKPPGTSRYGSLGALGRSPTNGYSGSITDQSNMSPFVRDVGQILLDDGSAFRELWSGVNPPRDEVGGGGSGTTSRRHSVSVVQPRRPIVGFNAPGADGPEEHARPGVFHSSSFSGGGGLLLTDDDLASGLNMLNLNVQEERTSAYPTSQPSSLPAYGGLSRSPPSAADRISPYQALHLNIPGTSYAPRQPIGSPSDSALSGGSPPRGLSDVLSQDTFGTYGREAARQPQGLMARFVPGQGIQHIPEQSLFQSPTSPTHGRTGAAHFAQAPQIQRRASDAGKPLSELGKGVPLHAVPTSWPLFIVEFKAGRTDLFYCTDLALDIRVGDLVIVEADRGRDLGKVVNDTITLAEVDAFQKQQKLMNIGYADAHGIPTSPNGSGPMGGKEISPKMIYGKAQQQDTQGLATKMQDETKALELCRSKVRQHKMPMEVVDAEYQWDRRKLTFYFVAEKRIDFRDLVRELFRLYKTRIWMASLGGPGGATHHQQ